MQNLVTQLKLKNPDLKEAEIEGLLFLINNQPGISSGELVRATGLPKETLRLFKSSISTILEQKGTDSLQFSHIGSVVMQELNLQPYMWTLLDYSNSAVEEKLSIIRKEYTKLPKRDYDQFFATSQTSVSKAILMNSKGMVAKKRIALLGDDDLISLTIGLLGYKYTAITVFDIDQNLLDFIDLQAKKLGLHNIKTCLYDVRKPMLDSFLFDVVLTDPPYTRNGIELFLDRAIQLLIAQNNGGDKNKLETKNKYVFLCYGNSFKTPEKFLKVQEIIQSRNLVIEDTISKFNRYYGAESVGSSSSVYVLKLTPYTFSVGNSLPVVPIYTFEDTKTDDFPYVSHFTFKLTNVPVKLIKSEQSIVSCGKVVCNTHKIKVMSTSVTRFPGKGFSVTFVLGSSNLLIHVWPELQSVHLDSLTCSPIFNVDTIVATISGAFNTTFIEARKIE